MSSARPSLAGNHYRLTCHHRHSCQRSCKSRGREQRTKKGQPEGLRPHFSVIDGREKRGQEMNKEREECGDKVMGGLKKEGKNSSRGGEEREGKTYGSDYKPVMSSVHVR